MRRTGLREAERMRIHFSAERPCALRLGGALLGSVGGAEKFAEIGGEGVLAEFLPDDGDLLPLAFRIGEGFFEKPPACADAYRYGCGADVFVRFAPRGAPMRVLAQKRCEGALLTAFAAGRPQLAVETSGGFGLFDLPAADDYAPGEQTIGGERFYSVLCTRGAKRVLCLYDGEPREVFRDAVAGFSCGERLRVSFAFEDIAGHTAERVYRAENGELVEESFSLRAREGFSPAALHERLLPFALFQEILAGGDPAPYLSPSLAEKKELLQEYLGGFCGVYLPKEIFYLVHGRKNAAGLVYRRAENAFDVKFFEAETEGGKIANLLPVE